MLGQVEIVTAVETDVAAIFRWDSAVEFRHDCFVCRRLGRTVWLDVGVQEGRCESGDSTHPAPIRLSAFDLTTSRDGERDTQTVRCRVSYWWSPFQDVKHPERSATVLASPSWVRFMFALGCRPCYEAGELEALGASGDGAIQTNAVWPLTMSCPTCGRTLATAGSGPSITLLD